MLTVRVNGLETVLQRYDAQAFIRASNAAIVAVAHAVLNRLAPYPPATDANRPGRWKYPREGQPRPMGFYERNRGWWYPIVSRQKLYELGGGKPRKSRGTLAARGTQKLYIAGYRLRPVSEQMSKSWSIQNTSHGAVISNRASYSAYVQSAERQSAAMRAIGLSVSAIGSNSLQQ
ncbi:MAG: hypothetical protein N2559_18155, partial [Anaerolineae bacterium]|nr:hypothetical protein [Anaerolineae bacterium]